MKESEKAMSSNDQDENPQVLDCTLELRIQDDYCRGLVRVKEDGRALFDEYIATRGLIASLLGNTQEPIMTCSCTDPGCAGFEDQESRLLVNCVHWTLLYHDEDLDLIFDRNAYENAALTALRHFYDHPWESCEFGTVPGEYDGYADFTVVLNDLFSRDAILKEKWGKLDQKTTDPNLATRT